MQLSGSSFLSPPVMLNLRSGHILDVRRFSGFINPHINIDTFVLKPAFAAHRVQQHRLLLAEATGCCSSDAGFPAAGGLAGSALLTRCEEVLVMLRLVERMVRMWRQDRGWHQRVSVLKDGHPGGEGAAERRGDDLSQRLGFVQQDVLDEKRRRPLRGRRRRVVHAHDVSLGLLLFLPLNLHQHLPLPPQVSQA